MMECFTISETIRLLALICALFLLSYLLRDTVKDFKAKRLRKSMAKGRTHIDEDTGSVVTADIAEDGTYTNVVRYDAYKADKVGDSFVIHRRDSEIHVVKKET